MSLEPFFAYPFPPPQLPVVAGSTGVVHLDGRPVGTVVVTGRDMSWGFGRFRADAGFETFAPTYGLWSVLLHEDGDGGRLARSTAARLAVVENAIDRIKSRLHFETENVWIRPFQLNIDGEMLEWKEY